jgi:hypothetical protein
MYVPGKQTLWAGISVLSLYIYEGIEEDRIFQPKKKNQAKITPG